MKRLAISLPALLLVLLPQLPSSCREQSQMVEPPGPPPSAPIGSAVAQNSLTMPVSVGANFWKTGGGGMLANSLAPGTVLTGILQQDISSNKSNPGDVFTLLLPYGGQSNGKQIVPLGSKIIGVIKSATPAKSLRFGQPGSIEISLQSLVLPDGRSVRFHGFIDHNANLDSQTEPKVRQSGAQFSDYGNYFKAFLWQFPSGIGRVANTRNRGADYSLKQGETIPIKVTENIGLPPPAAPSISYSQTLPAGYPQPAPPAAGYSQLPPPGYQQSLSGYQSNYQQPLVPGQAYAQYDAGSQLSRLTPTGAAPEPGVAPAGPQLRSELTTGQSQTPIPDAQGIHATPLTLGDN